MLLRWFPLFLKCFTGLTTITDELTPTTESSTTSYPPSISSSAPTPIKAIIIVISVLPTLILLITLAMIVTALECLRKHKKKGKDEASNIQCQENSAYQEVEHGDRVDHIQCLENSAYLEIKREHEFQCRENCAYQDCHTNIEVDNIQSSISYYEECM